MQASSLHSHKFITTFKHHQKLPKDKLICCCSASSKSRHFSTSSCGRQQQIKSFDDIPTKRSWLPSSFGLLASGGPAYLHEHCDRRHRELGPIFREQLGSKEMVFVADTKMIQTVIANEGARPLPNIPEAWLHYNRVKSIDRGLFFQQGESWYKLRRTFNKVLLAKSDNLLRFSEQLVQINKDLMRSWLMNQGQHDKNNSFVLDDLKLDLCKWSIESTCLMLFGQRLGCINSNNNGNGKTENTLASDGHNRRADELVENISQMFTETSNFQVLPVKLAHRLNLDTWKRFELASDQMLLIANEIAREFLAKVKQHTLQNAGLSGSLVEDLLNLETLDEEEILRSIVDLIIASADTTSNALQWMFYLIGKYENVQERLLGDARRISTRPYDFSDLGSKAPYLKGFVKEANRLYPTAPFLARTLDCEIVLNGYRIPAGVPIVLSLYTTSRMKEYFDEPQEFKPERWVRTAESGGAGNKYCPATNSRTKTNVAHAYASLPFGVGARKCIGYKVADLEMCLLIASFVDAYESSLLDNERDKNIGIKLRMTLSPDRPVRMRLRAR